jgi:hypothetical protein
MWLDYCHEFIMSIFFDVVHFIPFNVIIASFNMYGKSTAAVIVNVSKFYVP